MNRFEPTEPLEFRYRGKRVMDPLSDDWEQKTSRVALVIFLGVLLGALCLVIAEVKSQDWVAFLTIGLAGFLLLTRFYEASLVAFLALCWINLGSPAIAQGASGGGDQRLMISHMGLLALIFIGGLRALFSATPKQKTFTLPIVAPMLAYTAICIWSTLNSILFPNQAVIENGSKMIIQVNVIEILTRVLSFGGMLLIGFTLRGKMLRAGAIALIIPGLLLMAGAAQFVPTARDWIAFPQILTAGVLAAFIFDTELRMPLRIIAGTIVLWMIVLMFLINTEWVSGWLGLGTTIALITFVRSRRLFYGIAAIIACIIIAFLPYFYQKVYVANFYTKSDSQRGEIRGIENDRLRMLRAATRYATVFPLGIGPGNYRSYNEYFGRSDVWHTTTFTSAHGSFAQVLSETGWLGLVTYVWLLVAVGKMLKRYYMALPDSWMKSYMLGIWGGVIGLFVCSFNGDYLFPTYHNGGMGHFGVCVYTWLMIGFSIAIARESQLEWDKIKN